MTLLVNTFLPKAVIGFLQRGHGKNPDCSLEAMRTGKDGSSGGKKSFCEASALCEGFSWSSGILETLSSSKGGNGQLQPCQKVQGIWRLDVLKYIPSQVREPRSLTRVQILALKGCKCSFLYTLLLSQSGTGPDFLGNSL